ncbi:hypothetical protein CCR75_000974 [Bremia lactucae]|uniref:Protein kinase domain-containing protein n=1 Tax=Bremia lactucae TaxID=4779 RepID=A0A976FDT6_BRELC|nr:hypothetical protein CCR75_000974 [Bremia lactucae]
MLSVTKASFNLRSRIQDSSNGLQCVDIVECSASGRLFIDKHTFMTSSTLEGRNASATALQELDLHLSIKNTANIVKLESYALNGEQLHLLYEYCGRGDLLDLMTQELRLRKAGVFPRKASLTTLTNSGRRHIFTSILQGVNALHSMEIVHMDLSLENIFITDSGIVKVGDLGHAQRFQHDRPNLPILQVAKEAYAAPELLRHTEIEDARSADAWSLGVILWTLCTKRALIHCASSERDNLFHRMAECGTAVALQETGFLSNVPQLCFDLVVGLLDVNPKSRLSVEAALQHPWVKEVAANRPSRQLMKITYKVLNKDSEKKTILSSEIALDTTRVPLI